MTWIDGVLEMAGVMVIGDGFSDIDGELSVDAAEDGKDKLGIELSDMVRVAETDEYDTVMSEIESSP